jgi:hypothetical protein
MDVLQPHTVGLAVVWASFSTAIDRGDKYGVCIRDVAAKARLGAARLQVDGHARTYTHAHTCMHTCP